MKRIAILALAAISSTAFGQLWSQNDLANNVGVGPAGGDMSNLETNENTFGYGNQIVNGNLIADDFTVGAGGWNITSLRFYTYQTGATAPSITGVNFAIDSDLTNVTLTPAATITNTWTNVYRAVAGDFTSTNRRIQQVDVTGLNINLAAGTYWLKWSLSGTVASGPWQPHIPGSLATYGNNGQQSLAGGPFAAVFSDSGAAVPSIGADMPFEIYGDAVPEPATMTLLALGAAGIVARRRKNSK